MGRAFEKRKHKKMARWNKIGKAFTRLGKEIAMSVKAGGADPDGNPRLRAAMQTAKSLNMPKDRVEAAIKRASSRDEKDYEEVVYEGYGPHGVAILIETATDNTTRTVANMRHIFSKYGGSLGKSGSLDFLFTRKGLFKLDATQVNIDEIELDIIDLGAEDIQIEDNEILIYTHFEDYGKMQKGLEDKNIPYAEAELVRIPNSTTELTDEQAEDIDTIIEKFEEDDDVQNVFTNLA